MKARAHLTLIGAALPLLALLPMSAAGAAPPNPILYLTSQEHYTAGGKDWVRHRYDVFNKDQYPADMFAAAPALPPCGTNTNSSRSGGNFFGGRPDKHLSGFGPPGSP